MNGRLRRRRFCFWSSWEVAMASTLIGNRAVVIGAGMGGLTAAGALADHFDQLVVLERDTLPSNATGAACAWVAVQRPARTERTLPGIRAGSCARGSRTAQGRSRCSRRASGLRSLSATRARLVRLRGVAAGNRARRATAGGKPRKHYAAPALSGHGSVGNAKWRGGHPRAL